MTRFLPLALLPLLACNLPTAAAPRAAEPMVLRTYDVPQEYAAELSGVVRHLLTLQRGDEKTPVGNANMAPGGQLLVAAPESIQRGVKELVDGMNARKPAAPATVSLEAWVVVARPVDKAVPMPAVLSDVAPALEAISRTQGVLEFALMEKVQTSGLSGALARTKGAVVNLEAQSTIFGDRVVSDLEVDPVAGNALQTRVTLVPGKLLVLGQSGYTPTVDNAPFQDSRGKPGMSMFYVIRATTVASGA